MDHNGSTVVIMSGCFWLEIPSKKWKTQVGLGKFKFTKLLGCPRNLVNG